MTEVTTKKTNTKCILCFLEGEPVYVIASDGDKFIRYETKLGEIDFKKAACFYAPHIRKYDYNFSRRLLLKRLPIDKEFWK
jgi:hypothetical protein